MGRLKGTTGTKRYWNKEEKLKAIKRVLENHESLDGVRKDFNISSGLLYLWVKRYLELGEDGLIPKIKPGNPLT